MFNQFFKKKEIKTDVELQIPEHIAIIMDGNGRWAKKRKLPRNLGHKAGVEKVKTITKACSKHGVKYLTLYAFSTENWTRPEEEVNGLMDLLVYFLKNELDEMHKNNVCIQTIGDISKLPEKPLKTMLNAIETTKDNTGIYLTIALNYGGRDEIKRCMQSIGTQLNEGTISIDDIDDDLISKSLDTANIPDPDLMIRTSGEVRLSNYMLWQLAYTEFYFCDVYWPDFDEAELVKAIEVYSSRQRRFGSV